MNVTFNQAEIQQKGTNMSIKDLKNPEFQEKLQAAATPEEMLALAREEGMKLSDDELSDVAGGSWYSTESDYTFTNCVECGKKVAWVDSEGALTACPYCGHEFHFSN